MRRILKQLTAPLVLGAVCLTLVGCGEPASTTTSPDLASQALIRRDTYGVPHILAENEEAAAFAVGYAQAEDHILEIVRRYFAARGEEARYFGGDVENDFKMKRYENYEFARENFDRLTPTFQQVMNGFAAGLNYYVERHRAELPEWIPIFDGIDVLARSRAEVFRFAFHENVITEVQEKYATGEANRDLRSPTEAVVAESGDDLMGSNAWAIGPSRSTSGNPLLMTNPHQRWSAFYWEAHITVPGVINMFGNTFVGLPVLRHGFNDRLGWTHTTNRVDLEDVYALARDPQTPDHYIFDGESMPLTKKEITVQSRNDDGSLRGETRTYWYSHLGPIIHQTDDKTFAIKSAIFEQFRYFEEWWALAKTNNLDEFKAILRGNEIPMFNLVYADVDGNIMYVWNGTLPKRIEDGTDYRLDVPADTGKYVWTDFYPTDELPQLLNPPGGYVQSTNNPPWHTSLRDRLDPDAYAAAVLAQEGEELSLRTQNSLRMLEGQEKFSLEDVWRLKFDTGMPLADRVKPALIQAIRRTGRPSEALVRGLDALEGWDNRVSAESRGAVLFQRFWDTHREEVDQPFAVVWDPNRPIETPTGLSEPALAVRHFEEAVTWTRETYGREDVGWGEVHRIRLGDIDLPADGSSGGYGLFRVVQFGEAKDGTRVVGRIEPDGPLVGGGDGWIFVVEFSEPIRAYSLLAHGQTTDLASPHSTDQVSLYANHELKRAWFTEEEIQANLESTYRPGEESPR